MRYAGLFLATIVTSINSLNITDLVIPPYTQQGSNITLFCSYSVDKDKIAELDIKWYFGNSPSPFMVFLPHMQAEPQVVDPVFREKLLFSEGWLESGFLMMNTTTDLSGLYTCKVSTNTRERVRRKRIIIYSELCYLE